MPGYERNYVKVNPDWFEENHGFSVECYVCPVHMASASKFHVNDFNKFTEWRNSDGNPVHFRKEYLTTVQVILARKFCEDIFPNPVKYPPEDEENDINELKLSNIDILERLIEMQDADGTNAELNEEIVGWDKEYNWEENGWEDVDPALNWMENLKDAEPEKK